MGVANIGVPTAGEGVRGVVGCLIGPVFLTRPSTSNKCCNNDIINKFETYH